MPLQYPSPLKTGTQEQLSTNSTTILTTAESFIKDRSFSGSTDDVDNYRPQHSASFDNSRVSIPYEERSFSYYAISTFKPLEKINLSSSSNSISRFLSNNKKSAHHVDHSLSEAKHRFQDTSVYDPTDTDPFRHELPISRSTSNPGMSLSCATSNDSCVDTILSSSPDFESPHLLMESYLKWSEKNDPVDSYIPSWPLPRSDSPVSIADEEEIESAMNDNVFETHRKCIVACAEASQKAYPGHPVHEGSVASQFRPFALEEPQESSKTTVFPKCKPLRLKVQAPKSSKYLLGSVPMSRLGTDQRRTYTANPVAGSVPQECGQAPIARLTPRRHRSEIVDSHPPKKTHLQGSRSRSLIPVLAKNRSLSVDPLPISPCASSALEHPDNSPQDLGPIRARQDLTPRTDHTAKQNYRRDIMTEATFAKNRNLLGTRMKRPQLEHISPSPSQSKYHGSKNENDLAQQPERRFAKLFNESDLANISGLFSLPKDQCIRPLPHHFH